MTTLTKERISTVPFEVDLTEPQIVARRPGTRRMRALYWVLVAASVAFVAAGTFTIYRGWDARAQVRDQLLAEQIVTPEDASLPNQTVDDAATAMSQADIIQKHMLEATGGKTYAELERTDPARQTAFSAAALRTSLLSAVLAFNVANLAMGFGAFVAGVGLLMAFALILARPRFRAA